MVIKYQLITEVSPYRMKETSISFQLVTTKALQATR